MKFDPSGFTDNPEIRQAQSLGDYVARFLQSKFYDAIDDMSQEKTKEDGTMTTSLSNDGNTLTVDFIGTGKRLRLVLTTTALLATIVVT
jgi:N-methylhydantoinase B/oxoprolinase/acetone carboxylase alpha subunit